MYMKYGQDIYTDTYIHNSRHTHEQFTTMPVVSFSQTILLGMHTCKRTYRYTTIHTYIHASAYTCMHIPVHLL